jgi:hypothetical protein
VLRYLAGGTDHTYADAFLALAACFIIAPAVVPPMHKVVPQNGPSAGAR